MTESALKPNILQFTINGEMSQLQINRLMERIKSTNEQYGKVRLLGEYTSFDSFSTLKSVLSTLSLKAEVIKSIEKYAIITNKNWLQEISGIADFVTPSLDVEVFALAERRQAINWLE